MRVLIAAMVVACLGSGAQSPPPYPDNLKPAAGEKLLLKASAAGDQIYTCDGSGWIFTAPEAKLASEGGKQIGSHFAGPTWKSTDGSQVVGRPLANATPDRDSIPWLLLTAASHQGDGVMKQVSSIQRLSTKGGKAPADGCDTSHKGRQIRVPYTAVYYFYTQSR